MRKIGLFFLCLAVILTTCVTGVTYAEDTYYDNMAYRLGKGLSNCLFCPVELFRSLEIKLDQHGFCGGVVIGTVHGLGRTLWRAVTGVVDVVIFPTGISQDAVRLMEPEFALMPAVPE